MASRRPHDDKGLLEKQPLTTADTPTEHAADMSNRDLQYRKLSDTKFGLSGNMIIRPGPVVAAPSTTTATEKSEPRGDRSESAAPCEDPPR